MRSPAARAPKGTASDYVRDVDEGVLAAVVVNVELSLSLASTERRLSGALYLVNNYKATGKRTAELSPQQRSAVLAFSYFEHIES